MKSSISYNVAVEKIAVIGATGLVGASLLKAWDRQGAMVVGTGRTPGDNSGLKPLDIQDVSAVAAFLVKTHPELVALPASNPHVDYCETHPEETRRVNVAGCLHVVNVCREIGARVVYFSSDYVFDGEKGDYVENDSPNPLSEYGRQKLEMEKAVLESDARSLIVRTSGVYGWHREPKNFVLQVLSRLSAGQPMKVADDVRYNPTCAENLAAVVVELAEKGHAGVYHVVGRDRVRRIDFARLAADIFGLDSGLISGVPSAVFAAPAPRPKESSLNTGKVRSAVSVTLAGARDGLELMKACDSEWRLFLR